MISRTEFILGALSAPRVLTGSALSLEDRIAGIASRSTGTVAMWARSSNSGEIVSYNADDRFPAASVIKLVVLVSIFQESELKPHLFDVEIKLKFSDFVGGSEILDGYNIGDRISIGKLARAMIEQSDNTASNVLISYLGIDVIGRTIEDAGLTKTQLHAHFRDVTAVVRHTANLTSARDMGSLLYDLERGARLGVRTVASPVSCRHMIDILLRQEDRDKIVRGLPKGIPVANKTGEIDGVRNDIAIVDPYGKKPYILAVLTKDLGDFSVGNLAIRHIASAVHSAFY